ncbi:type II toxin-antitoxin system YafQ family toxin [Geminocystis sp. CENA526]|uniref:type II toxin-antitoxin system YafQ family toxin n=1 Tax=Geminocystis sp. CENA526 TaxID=1355871 RepID=UPI003D6DF2A0
MNKLKQIIIQLAKGKILEAKYKDHKLIGNYTDRRECHIEPDWLLIYKLIPQDDLIIFERTGTHSDLFN